MRQRRERMVQRFVRRYPAFLIDGQHALQQIDKLATIGLLRQQLAALQIRRHIHLPNVVQTVEYVLACLFAFRRRFGFVFLGGFQPPERIRRVDVAIEEFRRFAGAVEHVLGGQALRLRNVPE